MSDNYSENLKVQDVYKFTAQHKCAMKWDVKVGRVGVWVESKLLFSARLHRCFYSILFYFETL